MRRSRRRSRPGQDYALLPGRPRNSKKKGASTPTIAPPQNRRRPDSYNFQLSDAIKTQRLQHRFGSQADGIHRAIPNCRQSISGRKMFIANNLVRFNSFSFPF